MHTEIIRGIVRDNFQSLYIPYIPGALIILIIIMSVIDPQISYRLY